MSKSPERSREPQPYPPSWINHLTAWLARRPWPSWVFYLGLWLVLVGVQLAALWVEGVHPVGTIFPAQLFIPTMTCLFLAVICYLDGRSIVALKTLQPALTTTEAEHNRLRFQLSNSPLLPSILASVLTIAVIYLLGLVTGIQESSIAVVAASPVAASLLLAVYYLGWWVFGAFIYHTVHQLRVINRIYAEHTRVNLFALSPLYAFSPVTALTAVTLVIATYGWAALNPDNLSNLISIAVMSLITVLALAAFVWPLLGVRRRMAHVKAEKLDEVSLLLEGVFADLHQRIDGREVEEVDDLVKFISVLETERETLRVISTWPWQPEVLRSLVSALLLPLLLWIIQYVIQLLASS